MPQRSKEERKEFDKQRYLKNKDKMKQYYLKNKEKILQQQKEYNIKNSDKIKQYKTEYHKTEAGKKTYRISSWKQQGILCFDYNLLYDIFLSTNRCEYCDCELNKCNKSRKCLDHDHTITDKFNIRGVLCHSCNTKDVLKSNPLV